MTVVLAIETATAATAIALDLGDGATEVVVDRERRHTEVLAPAIARLLAAGGLTAQDLDAVVVDVGPGLFTGLRVGVATAKGLSVATGAGLHAVTSLDALAEAASRAGVRGTVVSVVDARRKEVFVALHDLDDDGAHPRGEVDLWTPDELARRLGALGELTVVGDGAVRHRELVECLGGVELRDDLVVPSPGAACALVGRRRAAGEAALGHRDVHPWYVREADAVANFTVRGAPR